MFIIAGRFVSIRRKYFYEELLVDSRVAVNEYIPFIVLVVAVRVDHDTGQYFGAKEECGKPRCRLCISA